ncbi:MAG TPA: hypothetical protein VKB03_04900 [Conexibacter sp.]|nr:hypothetical protein [Conexibacter sp.]
MRPVRNIWNELVERRLWPVALVLVAALVAVPLLLAKSPPATTDEPAPAPAAVAAAASAAALPGEPVVSVAQGDEPDAPLRGHAKNPFRQQHVQAESAATATTATATTDSTNSGSGSSGASGGGGGDSNSGGGAQPQPEPQPTFTYASVDVRFGHAGKQLRAIRDVPRLTPLPSATNPIVVFLGTRRDRRTAVFLVSTDVHVQGLGQCVPSRSNCEAIELRDGETAFLDFTAADGSVDQYELDLVRVTLHETTSEAVAQRAYARTSRVGRLLLGGSGHTSAQRHGHRQRVPFRWIARTGVLHIAPYASHRARQARAHRTAAGAHLGDLAP